MQFIVDDIEDKEDKVDYESLKRDCELIKNKLDNIKFRSFVFVVNEEQKQWVHENWHIPLEDIIVDTPYREYWLELEKIARKVEEKHNGK